MVATRAGDALAERKKGGRAAEQGTRGRLTKTRAVRVTPRVVILMGSRSDLDVMQHAAETLRAFDVACEMRVISAHRTPDRLREFVARAETDGVDAIIAGAGAAAHLAGVTASLTLIPVLGVPLEGSTLRGMDALLATVQMPAGIPVGTLAARPARSTRLLAVAPRAQGTAAAQTPRRHRAARAAGFPTHRYETRRALPRTPS